MNVLDFSALVWLGSLAAGFLGALTGLGGGVVLIPLLVLFFHIDVHYAMGASLVSVIATSSGSAAAYVREGFSNIRIGMFLEIATTWGAILGAFMATSVSAAALGIIFGAVLILSAWFSFRPHDGPRIQAPDPLATALKLNGSYPVPGGTEDYGVRRVPAGFGMMFGAGTLSGLLGIGSGAFKVLAMDQVMGIPFKVSTTTSNFMIGVTAAASAGIYLGRGYIRPGIASPVILGVLCGSLLGSKVLVRAPARQLRRVFAVVIVLMGIEMIYNGVTGHL